MLQALTTFAQDYTYYTSPDVSGDTGGSGVLMVAYFVVVILLSVLAIAGQWKVFEKAGKPGWAAIVPIYNLVVFLQVVGRPMWWLLLFIPVLIPFFGVIVGIVLGIILANDLAKSFGKDAGYTVLLFLLPFIGYPLLGFGKDKYKGPAALGVAAAQVDDEKPASHAGKPKA